jgi:hypothetical protein
MAPAKNMAWAKLARQSSSQTQLLCRKKDKNKLKLKFNVAGILYFPIHRLGLNKSMGCCVQFSICKRRKNQTQKETGRPIETENSLKRLKDRMKRECLINRADDGH